MKFFRVWAMCLIIVMGGLLSGCGNTTMLEEYSFGYTQLKSEHSEVFLMTPFQLGKANRQNGDGVMYVGNDTHINLMAISESAKEFTVQKLAETSRTMLEQTPDISNLQTKVNETTVNGKPAVETEYTYEEPLHEIQKVEVMDFENFRKLIDWDAVAAFRARGLNPDAPETRGTAENPDVYFQHCEANNKLYDAMPDIVAGYMDKISEITGRTYKPFTYVGAADAEYVVVAMGSMNRRTMCRRLLLCLILNRGNVPILVKSLLELV